MTRVTRDGKCPLCGRVIGPIIDGPGGPVLDLSGRWRSDHPTDPMAPRTWVRTDHLDRMRLRGGAAKLHRSVRLDDVIVCICKARLDPTPESM